MILLLQLALEDKSECADTVEIGRLVIRWTVEPLCQQYHILCDFAEHSCT